MPALSGSTSLARMRPSSSVGSWIRRTLESTSCLRMDMSKAFITRTPSPAVAAVLSILAQMAAPSRELVWPKYRSRKTFPPLSAAAPMRKSSNPPNHGSRGLSEEPLHVNTNFLCRVNEDKSPDWSPPTPTYRNGLLNRSAPVHCNVVDGGEHACG